MADSPNPLRDFALSNPLLAPFVLADELIRSGKEAKASKQPKQGGKPYQVGDYISGSEESTPPPPPPGSFGGESRPPSNEGVEIPGGAADIGGLAGVIREALQGNRDLQKQLADPEYLKKLQQMRIQEFLATEQAVAQTALEKSREKTYRDTQLGVLQAWNDVTRAQINKEAELAKSLATTAYLAHTPNQGVLAALSANLQSATSAYTPSRSVID